MQLGAQGAQHSPVGIAVKVVLREDSAGRPPDPGGTWGVAGKRRTPLPAAQLPPAFPEICARIWGSEPEGALVL